MGQKLEAEFSKSMLPDHISEVPNLENNTEVGLIVKNSKTQKIELESQDSDIDDPEEFGDDSNVNMINFDKQTIPNNTELGQTINEEAKIQCKTCADVIFKEIDDAMKHKTSIEDIVYEKKCPVCHHSSQNKHPKEQHVKRVHFKTKPKKLFQCCCGHPIEGKVDKNVLT